jgi:hypothetical protein
VIATLCLAAPAFANDTLQLTWRAPAECPSADRVRLAAVLDTTAARPTGVLVAEAIVEPMGSPETRRWRVTLRTRRGAVVGERTIEASTCDGIADATAIVLALALTSAGAPEADAVGSTPSMPVEPLAPVAPVSAVGAPSFGLGVSVAADASSLPLPTLGGSLTLAWTAGHARAELDVRRWAPQSRTLDPFSAGARFSMTSLGARGCWVALGGAGAALDVSACTGADVHFVSAPAYGVDPSYDASARWLAVAGGALARFSVATWLKLRTRVEAYVPLSRPTFVLEGGGAGPLHQPSALGAGGSLGIELLFL